MPPTDPIIDPATAEFLGKGVGMLVAACDGQLMPIAARACGCRVSPDRRTVTVFISAAQAGRMVDILGANGMIAVTFSLPESHRTIQLKGSDAAVGVLQEGDIDIVEAYRDAFIAQLAALGYDPAKTRRMVTRPTQELITISFTPNAAFTQTPGPRAGEPLAAQP
jgi:hypothetical protein